MRFKILSHAAIDIEAGTRLVIDPWLAGSCYWDSWWHYPESVPLERPLAPGDFVYLTHGHPDHLHEPSLREIDRGVTVLLPRLPVSYMRDAILALGFNDVVEIAHGDTLRLGPSLAVTSYQTSWNDDSALIVESGSLRLADMNDALFVPALLKAIAARHGPMEFVLKSHSSASAYPHSFESPDPSDLSLYDEADFIGNFFHYARALHARYAIPFASNVCFLHPESRAANRHAISPLRLLEEHARQAPGTPEVKLLLPGDGWSSGGGFQTGDAVACLGRRESEIERLAAEAAPAIAARERLESARTLRFEVFSAYFTRLLQSLPFFTSWLYRARIAFEIEGGGGESEDLQWWVIDFARRRIERHREPAAGVSATLRIAPGLLDAAIEEGVFGFVDISKRLHVALEGGEILRYAVFKEIVNLYEAGYLPLWRSLLRPRFLAAWLRRRRELWSYARSALRGPLAFVPNAPREDSPKAP